MTVRHPGETDAVRLCVPDRLLERELAWLEAEPRSRVDEACCAVVSDHARDGVAFRAPSAPLLVIQQTP